MEKTFLIIAPILLALSNHVTTGGSAVEPLSRFLQLGCNYTHIAQDLNADFAIAAIFPIHELKKKKGKTYTLNTFALTWVESFLLAVDQVNKNPHLLPNVTLGYDVRDTCNDEQVATSHTLDFMTDIMYFNDVTASLGDEQCKCVGERESKLIGMIGGSRSSISSSSSFLLSTGNIPQISYGATSPSLSEKALYPNFLRTVPSDLSKTFAIADLMAYFGWTYVSVLASDDEYGRLAIEKLRENLRNKSICFAVDQLFDPSFPGEDLNKMMESLKEVYSASKVVILWSDLQVAFRIIRAAKAAGMNDTLWVIGTETWGAERDLNTAKIEDLRVIRLKISDIEVANLKHHMQFEVKYQSYLNNVWIRQLWPEIGICPEFGKASGNCFPAIPSGVYLPRNRHENVMAAVYAFAYGLHKVLKCNDTQCDKTLMKPFNYDALLATMKAPGNRFKVPNSTMFIEFNEEGDVTVNSYNFQLIGATRQPLLFGHWYGNKSTIQVNDQELWQTFNKTRPKATCAYHCPHGTYKLPGITECCWQCIPCPYGEVSSMMNAPHCDKCIEIEVASVNHDRCIPLNNMRLNIESTQGQLVLGLSFVGFLSATFVLFIFLRYWNTPVVKSSSREMSVVQLICMLLLFSFPLLHMLPVNTPVCILRNVMFGSLHTLILAFILLKTYRLLRVFQPKRFSKISKFLHNRYQMLTSFIFVALLLAVLAAWYYSHTPDITLEVSKEEMAYIYHCGEHEEFLLYAIVGYIILLCVAGGFMAFRARRLPSNFNEAQYIWLAMFTCCIAWIMMFPLYATQKQYNRPNVVIGVNGASTFCLLLILYGYKVRIILFKNHLNSQEHFSKLAANATVTTFLKEVNPNNLDVGNSSQRQSVISFDFDGMFDEYKKNKTRKLTLRESFKHLPKALRMSKKKKEERKQKAKQRLKAKNKTLQLGASKTKSRAERLKGMPPKSASFDDSQVFATKKDSRANEFYIADFADVKDLGTTSSSYIGSDASLIHKSANNSIKDNLDKKDQSNDLAISISQSNDTFV